MHSRITKAAAVIVLAASAIAGTAGTVRAAGRTPVAQAVQLTGSQLAADLLPARTFPCLISSASAGAAMMTTSAVFGSLGSL